MKSKRHNHKNILKILNNFEKVKFNFEFNLNIDTAFLPLLGIHRGLKKLNSVYYGII